MNKNINFEILFFDLDGTLTDSFEGIANGVIYALDKMGIKVNDKSDLRSFIGPPLAYEFKRKYNFSDEVCKKATSYFHEYFERQGMFENTPYEHIDDLLSSLSDAGYKSVIATSKPEPYAKKILDHFNLSKYFTLIAGSELNGTRLTKQDVIAYAIDRLSEITNPTNQDSAHQIDINKILMIGDRHHDITGAKENGIASMGVLYGYGTRSELCDAGADFIAETVSDIKNFFIQ